MEEHQDDRTDNAPEQSFEELLAQSLAGSPRLEPGDKVEAKVLQIGAEWVFLDVGQKGEGVLDIKELLDADGALTVSRGDTVHAYFLGRDDDELQPQALLHMARYSFEAGESLSARGFMQRYFEVSTDTPEVLLLAFRIERALGAKDAQATTHFGCAESSRSRQKPSNCVP